MLSLAIKRVGLGTFPTPIQRMRNLERELKGPKLFVKRDDLTDLAMGGNKVRQLDYVLSRAKIMKADTLISTCGVQSNWSRQLVGASIKLGMEAVLVLRTLQFKREPEIYDGNILLDYLMGARIRVIKMGYEQDPAPYLEAEAEKLRKKGRRPLVLGLDALRRSPYGALGYFEAMQEISEQLKGTRINLDAFIVPGGGPTHAGLLLGAKALGMRAKVIGVPVMPSEKNEKTEGTLKIASETSKLIGEDIPLSNNDAIIDPSYAGKGYGIPTKGSLEAIRLVARKEALILDPVYTSKVMSGMLGMIRSGMFKKDDAICFVHTGGVPALFAYKEFFQPPSLRRPITII